MITKPFQLSDGNTIPAQGLGTWQINNSIAQRVVKDAVSCGYRHIDTAAAYENEEGVGKGIKASGISRKAVFVTTKIRAEIKTYEGAKRAIYDSLDHLQTGYIDLMLIHAPRPFRELIDKKNQITSEDNHYYKENLAVWKAMEEAHDNGLIRSLGVSNFSLDDVMNIMEHARMKPVVNQIFCNINHYPKDLMDACQRLGIVIESYSPNDTGRLNGNRLQEIADHYGYTLPQLGNRFDYQLGTVVLPKTTHKEYMIQNLAIDKEITEDDMEYLKSLGQYTGWDGSLMD